MQQVSNTHISKSADVLQEKMSSKVRKRSKLDKLYPFGSGLVQFMEERGMITLISDLSCSSDEEERMKKSYKVLSEFIGF